MSSTYDFVIVGAGSAGSVLAHRLSADAKVLLIEAGSKDYRWDYRLHMPAALSQVLSSNWYNWGYTSEPEPHLNNRRLFCPRGKVLGGSSSINGMIFVRGNPGDFNRWASEFDLSDWDYEHCLPFFRKSETALHGAPAYRGTDGPLQITRGDAASPLFNAWLEAGQQAGFEFTDDFNGAQQEGVGYFDRTISGGLRQNMSRTYLDSVRTRIDIRTATQVTQILIENGRATGVKVDDELIRAGEVIVSSGAINSPQLLMLSGIGDADTLAKQGIECHQHLPGVGQNLMDHLEIYVQYACPKPVSVYPATRWFNMPFVGLQWILAKQGAGATNHFEAGGFLKSSDERDFPDLQFHFLPIAMDYDGKDQYQGHGFQVHVGPMKPTSRGSVTLRSANPFDAPLISFNYNSTAEDRDVMRKGIRLSQEIVSQAAFDEFRGERLRPLPGEDSDEAIDSFVRRHAESAYHPSGTCRMGIDDQAVVDSDAKVHGVENLRVVDASIMPEITNGNLNAPVAMMAEKVASAILAD